MKLRESKIRTLFTSLQKTPLHPQWLIHRKELEKQQAIAETACGVVVDIGAGRQAIRSLLQANTKYLAVDYYNTSITWYKYKPDIFADAQQLPLQSSTADTVLLLDVLEHLPKPHQALAEIRRILKPQGQLIISVPFLYPLHDEPLDFHRWTEYGLKQLVRKYGFEITAFTTTGQPSETAAILYNIALCKAGLLWIHGKSLKTILLATYPLLIPLLNILGWIVGKISPTDDFAPSGYLVIVKNNNQD